MSEQVVGVVEERVTRLSTAGLRDLVEDLARTRAPGDEVELVDQLEALERVKSAACALQATLTDDLTRQRRMRSGRVPASVSTEVGMARRESPHVGRTKVRLATALVHDLPHTYTALACGDLNERRAHIIVNETSDLGAEDRRTADAKLATECGDFAGWGDRDLTTAIRRIALELDEEAALKRRAKALANRRVEGRVLEDGTARITAIVPATAYASIMGSLDRAVAAARAAGDERTKHQLRSDIAAARLAGTPETGDAGVPVAVQLVVSAETLLGGESTPGHLTGHGPIPASVARHIVVNSDPTRSTLRRLFAVPEDKALITMESTQRRFPPVLRDFLRLRDDTCRTPYCNAPIAHADHVDPASRGGPTSTDNGQGLCEWCNYVKDHPDWQHTTGPINAPHEVTVTTPTGHQHPGREPGAPIPPRPQPSLEYCFREQLALAV